MPAWALSRGRDINESDAAFGAGIALKSLDDLIRGEPPWVGCWRDRLAPKSAAVAAKMLGRNEEETALRDAVLLTVAGDDPGPAGKLFLATRMLTRRSGPVTTSFVKEIADSFWPSVGRRSCLNSRNRRFCKSVRASSTLRGGGPYYGDLCRSPGCRGAGAWAGRGRSGAQVELAECQHLPNF
jgi:hypothetical protein